MCSRDSKLFREKAKAVLSFMNWHSSYEELRHWPRDEMSVFLSWLSSSAENWPLLYPAVSEKDVYRTLVVDGHWQRSDRGFGLPRGDFCSICPWTSGLKYLVDDSECALGCQMFLRSGIGWFHQNASNAVKWRSLLNMPSFTAQS